MGAYPPINVFQQGHDFVAIVELPGVGKGDLELQAKENTIRISGKKSVAYGDKVSVHRRERVAGNFDRMITLPVQIDPNGIKADLRDGILALYIPRAGGPALGTVIHSFIGSPASNQVTCEETPAGLA